MFTKLTTGPVVNEANNSYFASWGDYDNDGDLDLFHSMWFGAPNNTSANSIMYQNNCNGNFTKITKIPGGLVTDGYAGTSSNWVDYDNDGDLDLYSGANFLYQNQGNGSFVKIYNAISNFNYDYAGYAATWVDYNNDGRIDMYRGNDTIYRNDGGNKFTAMHIPAFDSIPKINFSNANAWADYDNDGFMDVYICGNTANYTNYLYHNNGNGTFTDVTNNTDLTLGFRSYGCAWADVDNDGDIDLWVNAPFEGDRFFVNNGNGTFTRQDLTAMGLVSGFGQAGASFADYDNDGDVDFMIPDFYQSQLFTNDGLGNFTKITNEIVGNDTPAESYSAAWADYDNDGDVDLFVATAFGNPNDNLYINNVYENNTLNTAWLKFKLNGTTSNKNGIGARIYAKATINGISKWQFKEVNINTTRGGESGGASGQIIHMGFGDATVIDSLKIVWATSNTVQVFTNVSVNQQLKITEGSNSLSNIVPIADCVADLPIKSPAIVSGKLYKDVNNNCVFDAGDEPIANKAVQASPGNYYGFSDNNGDYTVKLPAGNYSINTAFQNDIWGTNSCQAISTYTINALSNQLISGKNFSLQLLGSVPCSFNYGTSIQSIGITKGTCPSGQLYQTPCPENRHKYCFTIRNNSLASSPSVSYATITFPPFFRIVGSTLTSPNGTPINLLSGNNTNVGIIQINTPLVPGQIVELCMEVDVDFGATAVFETYIDYNYSLTPNPNLVFNGGFQFGYSNFTSTYINDCYLDNRGEYCVGNNPSPISSIPEYFQTPKTGSKFLYARGSMIAQNVWCQTITGLTPNTKYTFEAYFNNLINPTTGINVADPQLQGTANGILVPGFTTPFIAETPNTWIKANGTWCSETLTTANLCIKNISTSPSGNAFGIDDISFKESVSKISSLYEKDACSCDPNDKNVSPKGCGVNGNIAKTETLTYKIRFQNTGNGVARNVLLRDELDADLDLSTLQILVASHKITDVQVLPNNALIVQFDSIMLPSILADSVGSNGFLVIEIAPKTGLADGTQIQNQVGIYFDQNEVVLTNSVLNTLWDNPFPQASYTYKHNCANTGFAYDFTNTSISAGATYFWEFEDAVNPTSTLLNPNNIVFNSTGNKFVKLTVNFNGCIDVYADSILVENVLSANGKKVTICHNGHNQQVSINALHAHLNHGDCVGNCVIQASGANKQAVENMDNNYETTLEKEQLLELDVFPNPANTELNFKISDKTSFTSLKIELYNFSGEKLVEKEIIESEKNILLKTDYLPTGIYLVRISTEKETVAKKIFIQH